MNAGLAKKRSRTVGNAVQDRVSLAKLLAKGTPGPLGNAVTPADPKNVSKEAQSIRLARLLISGGR